MELVKLDDMPEFNGAEVWPHEGINGYVVRFPNGYGASVISYAGSYGVELAVIEFNGPGRSAEDWDITYDTPVTSDVIGWCTREELMTHLLAIAALPARTAEIEQSDTKAIEQTA